MSYYSVQSILIRFRLYTSFDTYGPLSVYFVCLTLAYSLPLGKVESN